MTIHEALDLIQDHLDRYRDPYVVMRLEELLRRAAESQEREP